MFQSSRRRRRHLLSAVEYENSVNDGFEDTRAELQATSFNLTSVLINPRETLLEDITDEFSLEQEAPLEYVSPFDSLSKDHLKLADHDRIGFTKMISRLKSVYFEYDQIQKTQKKKSFTFLAVQAASGQSGVLDDVLKCFAEVPEIFFRPDFSLQDVETFTRCIGRALEESAPKSKGSDQNFDSEALPPSSRSFKSNLAAFLDLVEIALMRQICVKSPAFFRTIDDISSLQCRVSETIHNAVAIRKHLTDLNDHYVVKAIQIPRMQALRSNYVLLNDKLNAMKRIVDGKRAVILLLQGEDYLSALNIIVELVNLYNEEVLCPDGKKYSLKGIESLSATGKELIKYESFVCDVVANKFVSLAVQWVEVDDEDRSSPSHEVNESKDYMEQILLVLIRSNRLGEALLMFKRRITEDVQLIWRTCALEYLQVFDPTAAMSLLQDGFPDDSPGNPVDLDNGGTTLFIQRWRDLPADSFLASLEMCFDSLKVSLSRYFNMHKFITSVIQSKYEGESKQASSNANTTNTAKILEISKSCITAACSHALKDTLNLMKFRVEANIRMDLPSMKRLWSITLDFIGYTEKISGTPASYDYRTFLTAQSKSFLFNLHEQFKSKLGGILEQEKWTQYDVTPKYQSLISDLSAGKLFTDGNSGLDVVKATTTTVSPAGQVKELTPVVINGKSYKVPYAVLCLIEQVISILDIAESYSDINVDIVGKIVVLLEYYDQKTDKLVLGAEAMQTAGLKSITAKHLAIAAQSYDLISTIIPYIRLTLTKPHQQQLHHRAPVYRFELLDKVGNAITDHHSAILSKFVGIVDDILDAIADRFLRGFDWDVLIMSETGKKAQGIISTSTAQVDYFEEIQKNIISLHKTLSVTLPAEQLVEVFTRIFSLLKMKISLHFHVPTEGVLGNGVGNSNPYFDLLKSPNTLTGKQRIVDEVTYFVMSLSRLRYLDCSLLMEMEKSFQAKYAVSSTAF